MNKSKIFNFKNMTYIFFGIYIVTLLINNISIFVQYDFLQTITKFIRYICYAEFLLNILNDWKKGSNITLSMLVAIILALLVALFARNKDFMFLILVLIALKNMDINKIIKITFKVYGIIFFGVISLSLLKVIPDWTYGRQRKHH